jgi:hypothetical protein
LAGDITEAIRAYEPVADPADLIELCAAFDLLRARLAVSVDLVEQSGVWATDGAVSMTAWLTHHCRLSRRVAGSLRRVGRRLRDLPVTARAGMDGELSAGQVDAIVDRVDGVTVAVFADTEAGVVPTLVGLSVRDTERACTRWQERAQAVVDGSAPVEPTRSFTFAGGLGTIIVDSALRLEMDTALANAATFDANGEQRTGPQRRADALFDVCAFFNLHHTQAPDTHHRPHVELLTHADDVGQWHHVTTSDGDPVPAATAATYACDSLLHRVIHDGSRVIDYGRTVRTAPEVTFRAVALRDGGCRYPGCDRPVTWCHAHHAQPWEDLGPTDQANLYLVCSRHHHVIHKPGWQQTSTPTTPPSPSPPPPAPPSPANPEDPAPPEARDGPPASHPLRRQDRGLIDSRRHTEEHHTDLPVIWPANS